MGLTRTVAPAASPVTPADLAAYLKIPEDVAAQQSVQDHLTALMAGAVERCERVTDRSLITQTWKLTLDDWCDPATYCDPRFGRTVPLGRGPVQSVTSIVYRDSAGDSQTLASSGYTVDITSEPARIVAAYGASWPTVRSQYPGAIAITYVAGYGASGASVPDEIKARLKAYCSYVNENRGDKGMGGDEPLDEEFLDKLFLRFWTGRM